MQNQAPHHRSARLVAVPAAVRRAAVLALAAWFACGVPAHAQRGPNDDVTGPGIGPNKDGPSRDAPNKADPGTGKRGATSKDGKSAEANKAEPKPIPRSLRSPGGTMVPEGGGQRAALLAELYAYLATATDEDVAKRTATAIEHVWQAASSDTVNLLMERGGRAAKEKKTPLAIKLFEQAVRLSPDNPEIFSRRALVYYAGGDLERALGDLRRALALDPNHYRSLESLGQILKEIDNKKAALQVYRKLYQVHPYFGGAKSTVDELAREVEGNAS